MNNDKISKTHSVRDKSLYSPSAPYVLSHALKILATLKPQATAHFTPLHSSKIHTSLHSKPRAIPPTPHTPPLIQAQSHAPTPPSKHSPHASQNLAPRTPIKPRNPLSSTIFGFCFILFVFMGFAILRPIRDTLGLHSGQEALRWLFGATFMASIALFVLCSYVASCVSRRRFVDMIFLFFMLCLGVFLCAF